jgi:hypothetical protein
VLFGFLPKRGFGMKKERERDKRCVTKKNQEYGIVDDMIKK